MNQNLQKKIDNAKPGDELHISGTCANGPFTVNKDLTLIGPATLAAPSGFATLQITGGTVTLTNLSIDASGTQIGIYVEGVTAKISGVHVDGALEEGMRLIGNAHANVVGSTFLNNLHGVIITLSSSAIFFASTFEDNVTGFGVRVSQGSSAGFMLNQNTVKGNLIGIAVDTGSTFQMQGTTVTNNMIVGVGIDFDAYVDMFDPPSTIENNLIDVACDKRGGLNVVSPQTSATKMLAGDGTCLIPSAVF